MLTSPTLAGPRPSLEPTRLVSPNFSDRLVLGLLGLAVASYFVVRGWLNAATVIAAIVALVRCLQHRDRIGRLLRRSDVRWLLAAMAAPMVAVVAVALAHHELVPRYLDGPLRFLLVMLITLYLVDRRLDVAPLAGRVFPIAILLCAGWVFFVPSAPVFFWDGRAATYFIDPLFLSQHIMIAAFICLYTMDAPRPDGAVTRVLKLAAIVAAVAVALATQSRTGWTMVPILLLVWLGGMRGRGTARSAALAVVLVGIACVAVYWGSGVVHARLDGAVADIHSYLNGSERDTSIGIRLSLYRANWILFLQHPLAGWGYATMPNLHAVPAIAGFYTPVFEHYFVQSGGHNEFLQAMMRMGLIGLASRLLMFFVPLVLFARAARSTDPVRRTNGYLGLVVVVGYLAASLGTEVFNLIHAASFYALLVAMFGAGALRRDPP